MTNSGAALSKPVAESDGRERSATGGNWFSNIWLSWKIPSHTTKGRRFGLEAVESYWSHPRNQDASFARACGSIAGKRRLRFFGKGFDAIRSYCKYLSNHDASIPIRFGDGIDSRQNRDTSFRTRRAKQHHVVGAVMRSFSVFLCSFQTGP